MVAILTYHNMYVVHAEGKYREGLIYYQDTTGEILRLNMSQLQPTYLKQYNNNYVRLSLVWYTLFIKPSNSMKCVLQ